MGVNSFSTTLNSKCIVMFFKLRVVENEFIVCGVFHHCCVFYELFDCLKTCIIQYILNHTVCVVIYLGRYYAVLCEKLTLLLFFSLLIFVSKRKCVIMLAKIRIFYLWTYGEETYKFSPTFYKLQGAIYLLTITSITHNFVWLL